MTLQKNNELFFFWCKIWRKKSLSMQNVETNHQLGWTFSVTVFILIKSKQTNFKRSKIFTMPSLLIIVKIKFDFCKHKSGPKCWFGQKGWMGVRGKNVFSEIFGPGFGAMASESHKVFQSRSWHYQCQSQFLGLHLTMSRRRIEYNEER